MVYARAPRKDGGYHAVRLPVHGHADREPEEKESQSDVVMVDAPAEAKRSGE